MRTCQLVKKDSAVCSVEFVYNIVSFLRAEGAHCGEGSMPMA